MSQFCVKREIDPILTCASPWDGPIRAAHMAGAYVGQPIATAKKNYALSRISDEIKMKYFVISWNVCGLNLSLFACFRDIVTSCDLKYCLCDEKIWPLPKSSFDFYGGHENVLHAGRNKIYLVFLETNDTWETYETYETVVYTRHEA